MRKESKRVECNNIACHFYGRCCQLETELVYNRDDNKIDILFIGQGAGEKEEKTRRPFVGPAGKVLRTKIHPYFDKYRPNIILDNTIRARPIDNKGKNRAPTPKELEFCKEFVWHIINEYNPFIILPVGKSATETMIPYTRTSFISSLVGKKIEYNGRLFLPTFHPAAILHSTDKNRKLELEKQLEKDIKEAVLHSFREREKENNLL